MSEIIRHLSVHFFARKKGRAAECCKPVKLPPRFCIAFRHHGFAGSRAFYNLPLLALATWTSLPLPVLTPPCRQFGGRMCAIARAHGGLAQVNRYESPVIGELEEIWIIGNKTTWERV